MDVLQIVAIIIAAGGVMSAMTTWIPLTRFLKEQRLDIERRAKAEGVREQIISDMKKDIDHAHDEIRLIKDQSVRTNTAITELSGDVKHLVQGIKDIKNYLEKGAKGCL